MLPAGTKKNLKQKKKTQIHILIEFDIPTYTRV